jgi:hypothetical protein
MLKRDLCNELIFEPMWKPKLVLISADEHDCQEEKEKELEPISYRNDYNPEAETRQKIGYIFKYY